MNPVILPDLRFRHLWFGIGLAMVAAVTVLFLMPGGKLPAVRLWDKLSHAIVFVALAFWFASILVRRDLVWLVLALVAFGALIELVQAAMRAGRQAEWMDVVADSIGVLIGLSLALTPLGRWAYWIEKLLPGRRP